MKFSTYKAHGFELCWRRTAATIDLSGCVQTLQGFMEGNYGHYNFQVSSHHREVVLLSSELFASCLLQSYCNTESMCVIRRYSG